MREQNENKESTVGKEKWKNQVSKELKFRLALIYSFTFTGRLEAESKLKESETNNLNLTKEYG